MKKITTLFLLLLICISVKGQETIKFEKIGPLGGGMAVKVNGILTVADSTLHIYSERKGNVSEYALEILTKDISSKNPTYNCIGQVGPWDKHQFTFMFDKYIAIWTSINSFTGEKFEQQVYLSKIE